MSNDGAAGCVGVGCRDSAAGRTGQVHAQGSSCAVTTAVHCSGMPLSVAALPQCFVCHLFKLRTTVCVFGEALLK